MSADPDRSQPDADAERVEVLLFECLEAQNPTRALEEAAAAHPEFAAQLRQAYGELQRWDLVASTAGSSTRASGSADGPMPERLGEYRLLRRIGAGGMGVVFLARDDVLQRTVALKLIRPEHVYMPGARERFQREVETIARLQHPGIVPIYGVGKQEGMPYFTMQHIRGCSVSTALSDLSNKGQPPDARSLLNVITMHAAAEETAIPASGSSSTGGIQDLSWPDACVAIAIQVANALHHAHERGILHRDVKPSNILLTSDGRALLVDFGLAWSDKEGQRLTRSTSELGSLPYLPPEHISGDAPDPNRAADVYSLGVTLYEMLTLHNPFLGKNGEETRRNILGARPLRLRREQRGVSWELETVCLAAMDPDPNKRYHTMLEFLRELERVRDRQSIETRRPGVVRRTTRWAQRHPTAVAGIVVGCLSAIIALIIFGIHQQRARVESDLLRQSAEVERYGALLSNADVEARVGHRPRSSRRLLAQCREQDRGWEWRHLEFLTDQSAARQALDDVVQGLAYAPDGQSYVVATQDKVLSRWTTAGEQLWRQQEANTSALTFCRVVDGPGHVLITGRRDGALQVRNADDGTITSTFAPPPQGLGSEITAVVASLDGQNVYTTSSDGQVLAWHTTQTSVRTLGRHDQPANRLDLNADGTRLASVGFDRTARVFDTATGDQVTILKLNGWGQDVAWLPGQPTLLVSDGSRLLSYDLEQPEKEPTTIERGAVLAVACSADGRFVAAVAAYRVLHIYRVAAKQRTGLLRTARLLGHEGMVQHLSFAPDSRRIAAGGTGAVVRLWDPEQAAAVGQRLHRRMVTGLAFLDGGTLVSGDSAGNLVASTIDGTVTRMVADADEPTSSAHDARVTAVLPTKDGALSVDDGGRLMRWRRNGQAWQCDTVETGLAPTAATTFADQPVIACVSGEVVVLEPEPRSWQAHDARITAMACHGEALWTADVDGSLKSWHLPTGQLRQTGLQHPAWIAALLIAPDGSWIATSCADTAIRILDAQTGKLLRQLDGHGRVPMAMTTNASGSRLISSGGYDQEVRFWQTDTGRCLLSLGQPTAIMAMDFAPDRDTLALGDQFGNVRHLGTRPGGANAFQSRPAQLDTLTPPPGGPRHK